MFGKVGVGKSATANTLIGESVFNSYRAGKFVTEHSQVKDFIFEETDFICVDTPGLFDSRFENLDFSETSDLFRELVEEFHRALKMCKGGAHALVICISGIERCDMLTAALAMALDRIFGEAISTNAILCITRADDFESRKEFQKWVTECNKEVPAFVKLLRKCVSRVFPISNNKKCDWLPDGGRKEILDQISMMPIFKTSTFESTIPQLITNVTIVAIETMTEMQNDKSGSCLSLNQYIKIKSTNNEILTIPLNSLNIGDRVLTTEGYQLFIGNIHNPHYSRTILFTLLNGSTLEVTEDHLIQSSNGFVSAKSLCIGQKLAYLIRDDILNFVEITGIRNSFALVGAPLTVSGTIIVNGWVVSCFAHSTHYLGKAVFWPLLSGWIDCDPQYYTKEILHTYHSLPKVIQHLLPVNGI